MLGTLVSAYSLMVGIFAVISGPISDRIGRRRILLLGTGVMALALSLHVFIADYASFLVLRMLAGIAGGVLSGSAVSYIGDWFPYDRRGWATGWVMSGAAFGQIIGIPLGIVMAGRWGFRAPFYMFAVTMALTFILIWFRIPQPPVRRHDTPLSILGAARDYWTMLRREGDRPGSSRILHDVCGRVRVRGILPDLARERSRGHQRPDRIPVPDRRDRQRACGTLGWPAFRSDRAQGDHSDVLLRAVARDAPHHPSAQHSVDRLPPLLPVHGPDRDADQPPSPRFSRPS